jgi:RNA polymerase sigma factor (TIGR02999 family)
MIPVTQLLEAAQRGDRQAAADLLPLVYDELRKLAAARMANEKVGHTLNATALVHEAYLRLVGDQQFEGRGHFFAAAAEAMRRILVDRARTRQAIKRGGANERVVIDLGEIAEVERADELLVVHDVLDRLTEQDPTTAELVKLRYFVGLSMEESASALGLSQRKAERLWTFGRAWLREAIGKE